MEASFAASLHSRGFSVAAAARSNSSSSSRIVPLPAPRVSFPLHTIEDRRRRRRSSAFSATNDDVDLDDLLSALEPPDVDGDITSAYSDAGARFDPATGVATTFNGNDQQALDAAAEATAVVDRSHCRRLRVSGRGRLSFLHGQATNDFGGSGLVEYGGSGVPPPGPGDVIQNVVFALPDGRVRDFATAFVTPDGILLQASPFFPSSSEKKEEEAAKEEERKRRRRGEGANDEGDPNDLLAALERVVFPGDEVSISDVTAETASFALLGPGAASALAALGAPDAGALPRGKMMLLGAGGGSAGGGNSGGANTDGSGRPSSSPVLVARGGGLSRDGDGFTLILDRSSAADLWRALVAVAGATPMGEGAWERARVVAGRPRVGSEIGAESNASAAATALEVGLCDAVSVRKGCYVGQEAFSKVVNVAGRTKQQLWGLRLVGEGEDEEEENQGKKALVVGATLWAAGSEPRSGPPAGKVTSAADDADGRRFALALVSNTGRAGGGADGLSEGLEVDVEFASVGDGDVVHRARARLVDLPFASRELPERSSPSSSSSSSSSSRDGGGDESAAAAAVSRVEPNERGGREARLAAMKARLEAYERAQQQQKQQ